jgi:hypothetical protein
MQRLSILLGLSTALGVGCGHFPAGAVSQGLFTAFVTAPLAGAAVAAEVVQQVQTQKMLEAATRSPAREPAACTSWLVCGDGKNGQPDFRCCVATATAGRRREIYSPGVLSADRCEPGRLRSRKRSVLGLALGLKVPIKCSGAIVRLAYPD